MTNQEKFIEVMNSVFNAGFTKENMEKGCSPCGRLTMQNPYFFCGSGEPAEEREDTPK